MNYETAIGIQITHNIKHKTINFFDVNSPKKGFGGQMLDVVFEDFFERLAI